MSKKPRDLLSEDGNQDLFEIPSDTELSDANLRLVKRALITYEEGQDSISEHKLDWEQIMDEYDEAFSTIGLDGARFMRAKLTFNMVKKLAEKLDLINFNIDIAPKKEEIESDEQVMAFQENVQRLRDGGQNIPPETVAGTIGSGQKDRKEDKRIASAAIKAAVEYIMKEGSWVNALKNDKDGAFFMLSMIGNAFVEISTKGKMNADNSAPLQFNTIPPDRIFFNRTAVRMRDSARGMNARRCIIVYDLTFDEYMEDIVPEIADIKMRKKAENVSWDLLPLSSELDSISRRSVSLSSNASGKSSDNFESEISRRGQVAVYIDLDARAKIMIAGGGATIISQFLGDDFPHMMNDKPYIPVVNLRCFGRARGFYDGGMGHYVSELNQLEELLQNKTVSGAIKEVDPMDVLTVANGRQLDVQQAIIDAELDMAAGRRPIILNEMTDDGSPMVGNMGKLSGGGIGNSGVAIENILEKQKLEVGMNMRDVSTEKEKTAFAIQQEAAAQTALPSRISEKNAGEYKFAIEVIIDLMQKLIPTSNKTIIPTREIKMSTGEDAISVSGFKLGDVIKMMKKQKLQVTVEDQSGVTPTNFERIAKINTLLPLFQGTKAGVKLMKELVELSGYSFTDDEMTPPPQPQQA